MAIGIILLFIISSITPLVIGYDDDKVVREKILDDLAFYCYGGLSSSKFKQYEEILQIDYFNDDLVESGEITMPVKPSKPASIGPMDSPWPMQNHDTHHMGRSPYSTVNVTGLEKWRFYEDGWVDATPIIDNNGIIYFASTDWEVIAVYPDGTLKWSYQTGGYMSGSSPAIAEDGTIYVGSWDDRLYAINPDGTLKWRFGAKGSISSSPAIAEDGTIYFGTMGWPDDGDCNIYAINQNGTLKWLYHTGYKITCSPTIGDDGTVYCGSGDTYFYAINPDGTLKWRFKTGDYIKGPASIGVDGTIYIGSYDDYLYALYQNGTMKWKCKVGHGTETNPSIASDGTIYVGGSKLYAVQSNGTLKWSFNLGPGRHIHVSSPAISADGTIYVGTNIGEVSGGDIIAVNPDGTEKWRKKIADEGWIDSSPSIGEYGTVYIGSSTGHGGYLHAFGSVESNEPPETPTISGEINGKPREDYWYSITVVDPDSNPVSFYIDWGDDTNTGWTSERASGEKCYYEHSWLIRDSYTIRVKAKDVMGEESDWATLEVSMPKNKIINPFERFLENHPYMFPLLRLLLNLPEIQ